MKAVTVKQLPVKCVAAAGVGRQKPTDRESESDKQSERAREVDLL